MLAFHYYNPVQVYFENGAVSKLGEYLRGKYRCYLLVCAKGPFRENGLYQTVYQQLVNAGGKVVEVGDIDSNPKLHSVREGVELARKHQADCVVALGGGSAMDCSKLIALSASTGVDPYEYVWGSRPAAGSSLDTVMIPTIAATGTELNNTAVIVNEETREKYWCVCAFPKYCIMDPAITATLPEKLTVWGGMDILSHTFEYYFNGCMDSEFQLDLSEALITAVMRALETLSKRPDDLTARGELLWCSCVTWGTGLTKIGRRDPDMACHSIEESFSGYFDTHHGACLGVLTPRWMRMVSPQHPEIFARFARRVMQVQEPDDKCAAEAGINAYIRWLKQLGAPQCYQDLSPKLQFSPEELNLVAKNAWRIYKGKIGRLQPLSFQEVQNLLEEGRKPISLS